MQQRPTPSAPHSNHSNSLAAPKQAPPSRLCMCCSPFLGHPPTHTPYSHPSISCFCWRIPFKCHFLRDAFLAFLARLRPPLMPQAARHVCIRALLGFLFHHPALLCLPLLNASVCHPCIPNSQPGTGLTVEALQVLPDG